MKCRLPDRGTKGRRIHFSFAVTSKQRKRVQTFDEPKSGSRAPEQSHEVAQKQMVGRRVETTSRDRRRWWHALEGGGQIEAQHDELPNSGPRHWRAVFSVTGQAEESPAEMCGG